MQAMEFQSTLPARGATTSISSTSSTSKISIHAPRTGSDSALSVRLPGRTISIHAPRTGSDGACRWRLDSPAHFNPRSPHGERPRFTTARCAPCSFQSTLPARGATYSRDNHHCLGLISIHAPRTGSDELGRHQQSIQRVYFNPRSPHGERRRRNMAVRAYPEFQSTLPARGATVIGNAERKIQSAFQSTLPARGATTFPQSPRTSTINFNPRSPHGERLTRVQSAARADNFNPRSPHGERRWLMCETGRFTDFNPRSPHGERRQADGCA